MDLTDPGRGPDPVAAVEAQPLDTGAAGQIPALDQIFDFDSIKFITAAIFGLSPAYLFDWPKQGNKLLVNLNSTKPTSRTSA